MPEDPNEELDQQLEPAAESQQSTPGQPSANDDPETYASPAGIWQALAERQEALDNPAQEPVIAHSRSNDPLVEASIMARDQAEAQRQQAEQQRELDRQVKGRETYLKAQGVQFETLPDGRQQPAYHVDAEGNPTGEVKFKPAVLDPAKWDDAAQAFVKVSRDDRGNTQKLDILKEGIAGRDYHRNPENGEYFVEKPGGQRQWLGARDQAYLDEKNQREINELAQASINSDSARVAQLRGFITQRKTELNDGVPPLPQDKFDQAVQADEQAVKEAKSGLINSWLPGGETREQKAQAQLALDQKRRESNLKALAADQQLKAAQQEHDLLVQRMTQNRAALANKIVSDKLMKYGFTTGAQDDNGMDSEAQAAFHATYGVGGTNAGNPVEYPQDALDTTPDGNGGVKRTVRPEYFLDRVGAIAARLGKSHEYAANVATKEAASQGLAAPQFDTAPVKSSGKDPITQVGAAYAQGKVTPENANAAIRAAVNPNDNGVGDKQDFAARVVAQPAIQINSALAGITRFFGANDVADYFDQQANLSRRFKKEFSNPAKDNSLTGVLGDTTGSLVAMAPTMLAGGPLSAGARAIAPTAIRTLAPLVAGVLPLGMQGAAESADAAWTEAKQAGKSDKEANDAASRAAVNTLPGLALYMGAGAVGEKVLRAATRVLPILETPFARLIGSVAVNAPLNVAASAGGRALNGENPMELNRQGVATDIAFAMQSGLHAYGAAKYAPTARAMVDGTHPEVAMMRSMAADPSVTPEIQKAATTQADALQKGAAQFLNAFGAKPAVQHAEAVQNLNGLDAVADSPVKRDAAQTSLSQANAALNKMVLSRGDLSIAATRLLTDPRNEPFVKQIVQPTGPDDPRSAVLVRLGKIAQDSGAVSREQVEAVRRSLQGIDAQNETAAVNHVIGTAIAGDSLQRVLGGKALTSGYSRMQNGQKVDGMQVNRAYLGALAKAGMVHIDPDMTTRLNLRYAFLLPKGMRDKVARDPNSFVHVPNDANMGEVQDAIREGHMLAHGNEAVESTGMGLLDKIRPENTPEEQAILDKTNAGLREAQRQAAGEEITADALDRSRDVSGNPATPEPEGTPSLPEQGPERLEPRQETTPEAIPTQSQEEAGVLASKESAPEAGNVQSNLETSPKEQTAEAPAGARNAPKEVRPASGIISEPTAPTAAQPETRGAAATGAEGSTTGAALVAKAATTEPATKSVETGSKSDVSEPKPKNQYTVTYADPKGVEKTRVVEAAGKKDLQAKLEALLPKGSTVNRVQTEPGERAAETPEQTQARLEAQAEAHLLPATHTFTSKSGNEYVKRGDTWFSVDKEGNESPVENEFKIAAAENGKVKQSNQGEQLSDGNRTFSKSQNTATYGTKASDVGKVVDGLSKRLSNAPEVHVVAGYDALPEGVREEYRNERVEGFYDQKTGAVTLIAEKLKSPADVARVFAHEVTGHYGVHSLLGADYGKAMDMATLESAGKVLEISKARNLDIRNPEQRREAAAEYIAKVAETSDKFLPKTVNFLKDALQKVFGGVRFQDDYVRGLLKDSARYLKGEAKAKKGEVGNNTRLFSKASEAGASNNEKVEAARLWKEKGVESPYFKKWFGDSKVVDENGKPLVVYHGTSRPDRVGIKFDPKRATSGPMAFFTDDSEIASNYATGKHDTSLEVPDNYREWITMKPKGARTEKNISDAWWYLSPTERKSITEKLYTTGYENPEEGDGNIVGNSKSIMGRDSIQWELQQARGNALEAAKNIWLDSGSLFGQEKQFMDVLTAMGVKGAKFNDPNAKYPAVYPAYIAIRTPLETGNIPNSVMEALDSASRRTRVKNIAIGADAWDKNTRNPREWMDQLKDDQAKGENSSVWTSIPDWVTKTLKDFGYDGIKDTGGKMGGKGHNVWIPLFSEQIKSATGNRGTFDPENSNILFSKPSPEDTKDSLMRRAAQGLTGLFKRIAETPVGDFMDDVKKLASPGSRGQEARDVALILNARNGERARQAAQILRPLDDVRQGLDKMSEAERMKFANALDQNKSTGDSDMDRTLLFVQSVDRKKMERTQKELEGLGIDNMKNYKAFEANALPHYFENPQQAAPFIARKIQGSSKWMEHRSGLTLEEIIAAAAKEGVSLKLKSSNAVDLMSARWDQHDRFVMAHKLARDLTENLGDVWHWENGDYEGRPNERRADHKILTKYVTERAPLGSVTEGSNKELADSIREKIARARDQLAQAGMSAGISKPNVAFLEGKIREWEKQLSQPARNTRAQYLWGPDKGVQIIDNHLSLGLNGKSWFRAFSGLNNTLNMFQLGFGAFHAGFVTVDTAASTFANAIQQASRGQIGDSVKSIARGLTVVTPVIRANSIGKKMMEAWLDPSKADNESILGAVKVMEAGGAKFANDPLYQTQWVRAMQHGFADKTVAGITKGVLAAPFALAERLMGPLMEKAVPRMKLAVAYDMIQSALKANPNMSRMEYLDMANKVVRSVDNRLGQYTYDNIHMNKVFKDLLHVSFRSVGWNLGTINELGGGLTDIARNAGRLADRATGGNFDTRKAEMTSRMAYVIGLPIFVGYLGALTQLAATGTLPEDLKDYFFPKIGGNDAAGNPNRVVMPSYMKDVMPLALSAKRGGVGGLGHEAVTMAGNKTAPLPNLLAEMLRNKDFYGVKIRNEADPFHVQTKDDLLHVVKAFEPFSLRGARKLVDEGATPAQVGLPFVGITPPNKSLVNSDAMELAGKYIGAKIADRQKTQAEADRSKARTKAVQAMRRGDSSVAMDYIQSGQLHPIDFRGIQKEAAYSPLQARFLKLGQEEKQEVYDVATPKEKAELEPLLLKGERNAVKREAKQQRFSRLPSGFNPLK